MSTEKLTLRLYTTLGCHLCEQAESILSDVLNPDYIGLEKVEIADSDDLMEKYGVKIPVIAVVNRHFNETVELCWPFDQQQVIDLVTPFFLQDTRDS